MNERSVVRADAPIGVFDSGVGGLSVLESIRSHLPHESLIYVADSKYMPYGCKPDAEILERSMAIGNFFEQQGCKAMVVACNSATAIAVAHLRRRFACPVVGMEPAVKPAVEQSRDGVVGVLATRATSSSDKFAALLSRFAHATVLVQPAPGLVEQIEAGDLNGETTRTLLNGYLRPLIERGIDTLVLGCTHYPFLLQQIRGMVGEHVAIIDSGDAIARELERQLLLRQLLVPPTLSGDILFYSTAASEQSEMAMGGLWGSPVSLRRLPV